MTIKITVTVDKSKYGSELAETSLELDSDAIDRELIRSLAANMAESAIGRAEEKLSELATVKPESPEAPKERLAVL